MKKFKKLTALALTATMALSMAACGSGSDGTTLQAVEIQAHRPQVRKAELRKQAQAVPSPRLRSMREANRVPSGSVHGTTFTMTAHIRTFMMTRQYPMRSWHR